MGEDSIHDTGWLGYVIKGEKSNQGDQIHRLLLVVESSFVLIDWYLIFLLAWYIQLIVFDLVSTYMRLHVTAGPSACPSVHRTFDIVRKKLFNDHYCACQVILLRSRPCFHIKMLQVAIPSLHLTPILRSTANLRTLKNLLTMGFIAVSTEKEGMRERERQKASQIQTDTHHSHQNQVNLEIEWNMTWKVEVKVVLIPQHFAKFTVSTFFNSDLGEHYELFTIATA